MRSGIGISLYRIVPIVPPHCAHNSFCCCCCVLFCVLRVSKRGEWMISCCHRTSCKRLHCSGGIIGMNVGQCFRLCNGNYTVSDDDYSAAKRLISFACSPTLVFITFIRPRIVDGGCYRTFIESSNTFSQRHLRNIYLKWCNVPLKWLNATKITSEADVCWGRADQIWRPVCRYSLERSASLVHF